MNKIIEKDYIISAPIDQVWKALVDPEFIDAWGGGPSKMDAEVGSEFQLWGGDIHGKNIEVVKNHQLIQEWFGGDWPKPSIVTFALEARGTKTILRIKHLEVPEEEIENIDQGWDDIIWVRYRNFWRDKTIILM